MGRYHFSTKSGALAVEKIFKKFPHLWGLCMLGLCWLQPPANAGTVAASWEGGRAESGCATACSWVKGPCGSVLFMVFYQKPPLRSSSGPASPKWGNPRLPCVVDRVDYCCCSLCLSFTLPSPREKSVYYLKA